MVPKTLGKGSGAPTSACVTMQPGHINVTKQTIASPFSIDVDVSDYKPGTPIAVTIKGGDFKGILLQARKYDGSETVPIGTFSDLPNNTKTIQCTAADDSFTHANKEVKNEITVHWNPPSESKGKVKFYATVAQERETYWMGIESATLNGPSNAGPIEKSSLLFTMLIPVLGAYLVQLF